MGLLPNTQNCGLLMRRECRERFPHPLGLAIPTCITARAWRTCRDACRDSYLAVFFEVGGGENVPVIPGACATRNVTYLVRGPCQGAKQTYFDKVMAAWLKKVVTTYKWFCIPLLHFTWKRITTYYNILKPVMHIWVKNSVIIGSGNGLSPRQLKAVTRTHDVNFCQMNTWEKYQ